MVSNNKYLNTRSKMFDLMDALNASNQCNARLMAEEFQLSENIKDLTAEVKKLRETVAAKDYIMRRMDNERLKQVNEKRKLEAELTSLRRLISELAVENKLDSICARCHWQDEDGVSCNCPDSCFFAESEEA